VQAPHPVQETGIIRVHGLNALDHYSPWIAYICMVPMGGTDVELMHFPVCIAQAESAEL